MICYPSGTGTLQATVADLGEYREAVELQEHDSQLHTWGMSRLQHPVGFSGVRNDFVVPFDHEATRSAFQQGRPGKAMHVELSFWRHVSLILWHFVMSRT